MRKEENDLIHRGTYDGTIYYNPANKFCIISVKTAEKDVPEEARSIRRRKDHLIRFVATGYELPRTDAVELELDGEWKKGKYGMQLQVEQWHEIVPQTKSGVEGYLASGLIKGIGPALAKQIVSRFGVETLDILQNRPERLLEIKGITENKLEAIKTSYAESRMLQDLMTLLSPFKITPKTAQKIYQFFGPASVDILKKSPFELCQISGFGFLRVDAIVQKNGGDLRAPMRIKGALFWALEDSKGKNGHLFLTSEALQKEALQLLNAMAERLHIDTSDEIIYRARKLRQRHDELVIQCEAGSLELQAENMDKKYPHVRSICEELQKKYAYTACGTTGAGVCQRLVQHSTRADVGFALLQSGVCGRRRYSVAPADRGFRQGGNASVRHEHQRQCSWI